MAKSITDIKIEVRRRSAQHRLKRKTTLAPEGRQIERALAHYLMSWLVELEEYDPNLYLKRHDDLLEMCQNLLGMKRFYADNLLDLVDDKVERMKEQNLVDRHARCYDFEEARIEYLNYIKSGELF